MNKTILSPLPNSLDSLAQITPPMAISAAAAASILRPLSSDHCTKYSPSSSSKLSSFSTHRFPAALRPVRFGTEGFSPRSRPRILPLVAAKKQTFSSFEELLVNSDKPVLVDFYATWCGPCQFMVPILNEVGAALVEKIQVVKIDTEKYPKLADKYKIEALPTFILFKDGEPHDRFEGALTAKQLIERIESSLEVKK